MEAEAEAMAAAAEAAEIKRAGSSMFVCYLFSSCSCIISLGYSQFNTQIPSDNHLHHQPHTQRLIHPRHRAKARLCSGLRTLYRASRAKPLTVLPA
jgi:hypothetical protein